MTTALPAPPERPQPSERPDTERHRAPALWLVVAALAATCAIAMTNGARAASATLVAVLVCAAAARLIGRGRSPEGIAVRSTWVDVVILLGLGIGIGILMLSPGV